MAISATRPGRPCFASPEPFARPRPAGGERVFVFRERSTAVEAARDLIDPMVSGVYAGVPRILPLQSTFPRIEETGRGCGSLVQALPARQRETKRAEAKPGDETAGSAGALTSFLVGPCPVAWSSSDPHAATIPSGRGAGPPSRPHGFLGRGVTVTCRSAPPGAWSTPARRSVPDQACPVPCTIQPGVHLRHASVVDCNSRQH